MKLLEVEMCFPSTLKKIKINAGCESRIQVVSFIDVDALRRWGQRRRGSSTNARTRGNKNLSRRSKGARFLSTKRQSYIWPIFMTVATVRRDHSNPSDDAARSKNQSKQQQMWVSFFVNSLCLVSAFLCCLLCY